MIVSAKDLTRQMLQSDGPLRGVDEAPPTTILIVLASGLTGHERQRLANAVLDQRPNFVATWGEGAEALHDCIDWTYARNDKAGPITTWSRESLQEFLSESLIEYVALDEAMGDAVILMLHFETTAEQERAIANAMTVVRNR
jgi:hypothetical protein